MTPMDNINKKGKLHYWSFCFVYTNNGETASYRWGTCGTDNKFVNEKVLKNMRNAGGLMNDACLMSVSYLGYMNYEQWSGVSQEHTNEQK